jgi:intein/homing endonuclease
MAFVSNNEVSEKTFEDVANKYIKDDFYGAQQIKEIDEEVYTVDENGKLVPIVAVSRLTNPSKEIITIELDDGKILKITPDQKIFDNNSKTLVRAGELLKNPEKYDI